MLRRLTTASTLPHEASPHTYSHQLLLNPPLIPATHTPRNIIPIHQLLTIMPRRQINPKIQKSNKAVLYGGLDYFRSEILGSPNPLAASNNDYLCSSTLPVPYADYKKRRLYTDLETSRNLLTCPFFSLVALPCNDQPASRNPRSSLLPVAHDSVDPGRFSPPLDTSTLSK
jgi:hypothetical protein